jgi:predicted secreted protein
LASGGPRSFAIGSGTLSGMRRRILLVGAVFVLLAGCGGPRTVDVDLTAGSVQIAAGETLRVDLGQVNASIGDSWYLVGTPDSAVLSEGEKDYDTDCDAPGCGGRLAWVFTARGPGETTLVFRYCYRSSLSDCQPEPGRGPQVPVQLAVTVN